MSLLLCLYMAATRDETVTGKALFEIPPHSQFSLQLK